MMRASDWWNEQLLAAEEAFRDLNELGVGCVLSEMIREIPDNSGAAVEGFVLERLQRAHGSAKRGEPGQARVTYLMARPELHVLAADRQQA